MVETHPFGDFIPNAIEYMLIGSFTTKEAFDDTKRVKYVWYYSNGGRNQFWPILEQVYGLNLQTRVEMEGLFRTLGMAMVDLILSCERKKNSNLDVHLTSITYNTKSITKVIKDSKPRKIYFTSRFVETRFRSVFKELIQHYPELELITLPSPSPRYVLMNQVQKVERYKALLPKVSQKPKLQQG